MKRFLLFTILSLALSSNILFPPKIFCAETYYIDNDRVLLYKIINWWYDSLPQDDELLCGSLLRYENKGPLRIDYDPVQMRLQLHIPAGFAELVSIFNSCPTCPGPPIFKSRQLNPHYFGKAEAIDIPGDNPTIGLLVFEKVDKQSMKRLWGAAGDMVLVLKGRIGGLLSGKVSLHLEGEFIKRCPKPNGRGKGNSTLSLTLLNAITKEVMVKYVAPGAS